MLFYHKNNLIIFLALELFLLTCRVSSATEQTHFVYPTSDVTVTSPQIRIVSQVASEEEQVLFHFTDSQGAVSKEQLIPGTVSSRVVALKPGLNSLILTNDRKKQFDTIRIFSVSDSSRDLPPKEYNPFFLHPGDDLTSKCTDCHPHRKDNSLNYKTLEQKISCSTAKCHQNFGRAKFIHGPVEEGLCIDCHNPHGTVNKNFLTNIRGKLCFSCHTELEGYFEMEVKHFPVARGECLSCHDPHQSNLEFHLKRGSIMGLCAGCHGQRVTNHKVMHEPVESGDCIACHNPHVSRNKGLLNERGNKMCFVCHTVREKEFQRKFVHQPVAKDCGACHDPHGSETDFHLRTLVDGKGGYLEVEQPLKESCLICHRKLDPEVARRIESAPVQHKPVAEGKCTACHTPHSTNHRKQLKFKVSDTCLSCHKKMKKHLAKNRIKHGPIIQGNCTLCHLVHGSDFSSLLAANFDDDLTANFEPEKYTLCFSCHPLKAFEKKEGGTTNFRNGLQNLHFSHINSGKFIGCTTCHEIHASNQERHIRKKSRFMKRYKISLKYTKTKTGGTCTTGCHSKRAYDRDRPVDKK